MRRSVAGLTGDMLRLDDARVIELVGIVHLESGLPEALLSRDGFALGELGARESARLRNAANGRAAPRRDESSNLSIAPE